MGTERATTGGRSFTGQAVCYRPADGVLTGAPLPPTGFIPGKSNTMKPMFQRVKEKVQTNTRYAERINEPTYLTVEGQIQWLLNPIMGLDYFESLLGATANTSAVSVVASTGPAVTADGLTTIPITGAFVTWAPIYINTDVAGVPTATTECVPVVSYTAGTLVVPALTINAAAISGTKIAQPVAAKYANSLLPAGYETQTAELTVERNIGGKWAYQFNKVLSEKVDLTFGATTIDVAMSMYGTTRHKVLNSGTTPAMATYAPSSGDEAQGLKPFTAINGHFVALGDPDGSGTSTLRAAIGIRDAKISFDNGLKKYNVYGNDTMQATPGDDAKLDLSYNELDTAYRPALFDDAIAVSGGAAFLAYTTKNIGTLTTPVFKAMVFALPFVKFEDSEISDKLSDVNTWLQKATGQVQRGGPQDLMQAYVL